MTKTFLTHHKCASGWLSDVIYEFFGPRPDAELFSTARSDVFPKDPGRYEAIVIANADWNFAADRVGRAVHIVRNPLAIVVSSYFSHLYSHPTDGWPQLAEQRERLGRLDQAAGLRATVEFCESIEFAPGAVGPLAGLDSFADAPDPFRGGSPVLTVRMEDLVLFPAEVFARIFAHFGEPLPDGFRTVLDRHTFEKKSGGRNPGHVDPTSHYRSGNPADWARHLDFEAAAEIVARHRPFVESHYPEIGRLLSRPDAPAPSFLRAG